MKKTILLLSAFLVLGMSYAQDLVLSEIFISPPGDDAPNEYIEIRGTPGAIVAAGTYIVTVDGDFETSGNGPGDLESDIMDLSGYSLGSNGYLVLLATGNPYQANNLINANSDVAMDLNDGNIEDQSHTILLINTSTPPTGSDDIDTNNDGIPDGVYLTWTILDAVAFADDDESGLSNNEYAYADVIFAEAGIVANLLKPASATVVSTSTQYDYVARIGNSTGSSVTNDETTSDWVGGDISSGNVPNWVMSSTTDRAYPNSFAGSELNHIGGPNPSQNTTLGVDQFDTLDGLTIYPNPAKTNLNIKLGDDSEIDSVELYSILGRNVLTITKLVNDTIDVSELASGVYLLKVNSGNNSVTKRIVIE